MKELLTKLRSNIKTVIAIASAIVIVVCAAVVIFQVKSDKEPKNTVVSVYKAGGKSVVRISGKELILDDTSADNFTCDKENKRVFYLVNSASSDSLYDLCCVELKKGEITQPRIIDYGIEKQYGVSCGKVYYLKFNKSIGADDGCCCNLEEKKISTFAENVSTIYTLDGTSEIYFTKYHGDTRHLYRFDGEAPVSAAQGVVSIYAYNDTEKPHIIFETQSKTKGASNLYVANAGTQPELICDNAVSVMYDSYKAGGNLYYFTSSEESVSWSYVISDNYAESDKEITRPKRTDFFSIFGVSFEYNEALIKYQDKLIRDEIRAALNESVANGDFSVPAFTAFAYTAEGTVRVADAVDPEKVYSVAEFGTPKIVFEAVKVLNGDTAMDTLVDIAQRSDIGAVIKYAKSIVTESIVSDGLAVGANIGGEIVKNPLSEYDKTKTIFSFSRDGGRLFALVRDSAGDRLALYTTVLDASDVPSARIIVDTDISNYRFEGNKVIYLKSDIGKASGDVFSYDGEKSTKLSNAANAFTLENGDNIVVLKNYGSIGSASTADLYVCNNDGEKQAGSGVCTDDILASSDGTLGFISVDENGVRSFNIYSDNEATVAAENVDKILLLE